MGEEFLNGKVILHCGDCLDVLKTLSDNSVDSCVTDPPYHLTNNVGSRSPNPGQYTPIGCPKEPRGGFMGEQWDGGDIAFRPEVWAQVLRVLKPGGHLLAFGGTRTYHRMACAIEDAGFEIRDCIQWLYGSGFPKSHDVSKGIDRAAGAEREVIGAHLRPDGSFRDNIAKVDGTSFRSGSNDKYDTSPATDAARQWEGWGTALKPATENIILAQKPCAFWGDYHLIGSQLIILEARLWSMLPASTAEKYFGLNRSEYDAVCASAQWSADERSSTQAALSEAMGTLRYVSAIVSSLNTVFSWSATWAEGLRPENTSITETALKAIIDLRTLKSLLSRITPSTIMQAHKIGLWSIACALDAERILDATARSLHGTLEQHALAPVIAKYADSSLDVGVKPNAEPICLARKPLSEGTVAANVLKWGTGAINVDGCRVEHQTVNGGNLADNPHLRDTIRNGPTIHASNIDTKSGYLRPSPQGRWPANCIHDGSEEVVAGFPDCRSTGNYPSDAKPTGEIFGGARSQGAIYADDGSAARFFYTAKADSDDRLGSKHPTVKPLDLMQYLVRLVTPKRGAVLDPFAGTGSTGEAAWREGMRAILIEREVKYQADIRRRMKLAMAGPDERAREAIKARTKDKPIDNGPLFAGIA